MGILRQIDAGFVTEARIGDQRNVGQADRRTDKVFSLLKMIVHQAQHGVAFAGQGRIDLVGATDPLLAGACLARSALFVGNDSGLMHIAAAVGIPTIGIGAGADTDGQVLVFHDLLGLNPHFNTRFMRRFADGATVVADGLAAYAEAVAKGKYPGKKESY